MRTDDWLFTTDNAPDYSEAERATLNDAASALLFAEPDGADPAQWRKSVADALNNVWVPDLSADDLCDRAAQLLGVPKSAEG